MEESLSVNSFEGLIGATPEMRKVFEDSRKIAETRVPVLVSGEFGTGRRALARAIHKRSGGEEKHFMVMADYGNEKTSPVDIKAGLKILEKGSAGTFYVEEIATLSLAEQFDLEGIIRSSGSASESSDARVIAATSRDLKGMIREGKFRGDLYFLFFVIKLPLLRERKDDIPALSELFLKKYSETHRKRVLELHPKAVVAIMRHSWPENVAELANRIKRGVLTAERGRIITADLELQDEEPDEDLNFKKAKEKFEKEFLIKAIARNKGNITQAAFEIGISRPTIYEMIKKYGIQT
jgi:two-component system, NtrC family, response regulator